LEGSSSASVRAINQKIKRAVKVRFRAFLTECTQSAIPQLINALQVLKSAKLWSGKLCSNLSRIEIAKKTKTGLCLFGDFYP